LISDDFPTLDRPIKANSGLCPVGHSEILLLLFSNIADFMIMGLRYDKRC